jgi:protein TonB
MMEPELNYFNRSMNEIVFEKKNRDYGAFLLRHLYRRHLTKALLIVVLSFVVSTTTPLLVRHFGLFDKGEILQLDTTVFVLHAPPSINPLVPPKAPPPAPEVKRPTEKFVEMEAIEKERLAEEPPPTKKDLEKKDISTEKTDKPVLDPPLKLDDLVNGTGTAGDGKIWNKVEEPPEFIGGEDARYFYMSQNLVYPDYEKGHGIEGVARIYFIINQDGTIDNVKVIKSTGNIHLDTEAARLISSQPKYKPGKQNGRAVRVATITDIEFKLR